MGNERIQSADVIVVGGGLAGLAAAAFAARAGRSVLLCEQARLIGGRATTQNEGGFLFNLGPHALYNGSAARPILKELGVAHHGKPPSASGAFGIDDGRKQALPAGFVSLLTTGLLRLPGKVELARLMAGLARLETRAHDSKTVNQWLAEDVRHEDVRRILRALVRVATYVNAPDHLSAGAAIRQLQLAFGSGVTYLDGGWQTLVDGLRQAGERAGVRLAAGTKVEAVEADACARGVRLAGGEKWAAAAVILTGSPGDVSALVHRGDHLPLRRRAEEALAVRAACLDVGLSRLPRERATFALGIDQPLYLSVHSAAAKLAPDGRAVIHAAEYLPVGEDGEPRLIERRLEGALDLVQPGWRQALVERRFLPRMTVAHHLPTAAAGGTAGRAPVEVPGIANLFVAGDWVGPPGLLADAALASARHAAQLAVAATPLSAAA
jgi:phytoene dehydrogenase-like protein